ncbi:hypothetical protein LXL04_028581 [Taraxacum kok-saghyz]
MSESGWTEVRRRKRPETTNNDEEITFFVSNIPKEARKGEFHKVFSRFGKLTDVYMGTNIGKNGKHYVFIRFKQNLMDTYCGTTTTTMGREKLGSYPRSFGKTIAPFDEIHHRVDLSCVNIGILTHRKNRINDEIYIEIDNDVIKIGVIDFDEDYWFPFHFDPRKGFLETEFGKDIEVEHKGETVGKDDDMEECKIHPEMEAEVQGETMPIQDKDTPNTKPDSTKELEINDEQQTPVVEKATTDLTSRPKESLGKRKRGPKSTPKFPVHHISSMANLSEDGDAQDLSHTQPITSPEAIEEKPPNFIPPPSEAREPTEKERTLEIGWQLGFQIESGDPILHKIMGETGETNIPQ